MEVPILFLWAWGFFRIVLPVQLLPFNFSQNHKERGVKRISTPRLEWTRAFNRGTVKPHVEGLVSTPGLTASTI